MTYFQHLMGSWRIPLMLMINVIIHLLVIDVVRIELMRLVGLMGLVWGKRLMRWRITADSLV